MASSVERLVWASHQKLELWALETARERQARELEERDAEAARGSGDNSDEVLARLRALLAGMDEGGEDEAARLARLLASAQGRSRAPALGPAASGA